MRFVAESFSRRVCSDLEVQNNYFLTEKEEKKRETGKNNLSLAGSQIGREKSFKIPIQSFSCCRRNLQPGKEKRDRTRGES